MDISKKMKRIVCSIILGFLLSGAKTAQSQTFSFKMTAPAGQNNSSINLNQQANPSEGVNLEESSFITPINLKGGIDASSFCFNNQGEFNIKNIICSPVNSENVRLTLNTTISIAIPASLSTVKFTLYSVSENITDGFTSIKVDGANISGTPTTIPRFTNIGTNESGSYMVPVEIEMPFKGLNFKNNRNSFLNFYLEVSDL